MRCDIHGNLGQCTCPGIDEHTRSVAFTPGNNVMVKWCTRCDKYCDRCKCETPEFAVIMGGKNLKGQTFKNALGQLVEIDEVTKVTKR